MAVSRSSQPNVLIVMSDQHSRRRLGCYGDSLVRTPNLDALASRGVRFENAYCPAPLCVPSRMSFLTGRHPSANRVWLNSHTLSSAIPTWAHALGAAGYETALLGRMHFVGSDQRHGFERRPIGEYWSNYPGASNPGAPLFKRIPSGASGQTRIAPQSSGIGSTTYSAMDEMIAATTCRYLQEKADGGGRPFAATVGLVLPHCPYYAPEDLFDYYYERTDIPQPTREEIEREPASIRNLKRRLDFEDPLPAERIRIAVAAYLGLCEYVDRLIGNILQKLEETGLDRSTLVIYCSDHGEMAGEHGLWGKSNYYEESAGVPIIASLPGVVAEGDSSPEICSLVDIGPTIIEAAGADPIPNVDGRSLWPLLTEAGDPDGPGEIFSELGGFYWGPPSRMIRRGPWKLFKYHDETPPALFNLEDDPEETADLGTDPRYDNVRQELLRRLYDGWDPESVISESERLDTDLKTIASWGRAVQPEHEDVLPIPDAESESILTKPEYVGRSR